MKLSDKHYTSVLKADKPHIVDNRYAMYEAIKRTFSEKLTPYDGQNRAIYERLLNELVIQLKL